ncbi:MAG: bifunctional oligoribonuclease/PAP phosphatase NrnA [Clostridia bacterium]|nr:bifunctional oligoribonuclease/PAP phosphatase NrnA [Clostridia bacterium]
MSNKLNFVELLERLKGEGKALILCHKSPDPDTLGSAFGLKAILEHLGMQARVACADKPISRFAFITGDSDLTFVDDNYDKIIAVDVSTKTQLGDLSYLSERVDLIIDHHQMNTDRFADYYEDFCASCAEIIYLIANALEIIPALGNSFGESIYAGITGDTGGFRFSNTTRRTMEIGGELVRSGIDFAEINRRIFDSKSIGEIRATRLTYDNMKLYSNGSLAIIMVTNKLKDEWNVTDEDISDIVSLVRSIDGVLVAVSIKQNTLDPTKFAISSRSSCDIDVSAVCGLFGGGGHKRASGATIIASRPDEALKKCVVAFKSAIEEYKARF